MAIKKRYIKYLEKKHGHTTAEPLERAHFTNTLTTYAEYIKKTDKTLTLHLLFSTVFLFYFLINVVIGPFTLGLITANSSIPRWILASIVVASIVLPSGIYIWLSMPVMKINSERQRIIKEFLRANNAIHIKQPVLQLLSEYLQDNSPENALKLYNMNQSEDISLEAIKQVQSLLFTPGLLAESVDEKGIKHYSSEILIFNVSPIPFIIITGRNTKLSNWSVVASLPKRAQYANLYVDVQQNGRNVYLSKQEKVSVMRIDEIPYDIYATREGGADAYELINKLSIDWLKEADLSFDFEIFNNILVLQQSLPKPTFWGYKNPETLYNPETIHSFYDQLVLLHGKLQKHGISAQKEATLDLRPFSSQWHEQIKINRNKYIRSQARRYIVFFTLLSIFSTLVLLSSIFISVLMISNFTNY